MNCMNNKLLDKYLSGNFDLLAIKMSFAVGRPNLLAAAPTRKDTHWVQEK